MNTIRKKFKFEMAHVLSSSYSQECQRCHGHSYTLEIIISAIGLNNDGMIIDFKKLKEIVKENVIDKFDHQLIIERNNYPESTIKINNITKIFPWLNKIIFVSYNPTAENMAKDIYSKIYSKLNQQIPSLTYLKVRLHETSTGWAEYSGGANESL